VGSWAGWAGGECKNQTAKCKIAESRPRRDGRFSCSFVLHIKNPLFVRCILYKIQCWVSSEICCHRGHRGHREEEIRNPKEEIRNNIKTRMLEWSKRKGIADFADLTDFGDEASKTRRTQVPVRHGLTLIGTVCDVTQRESWIRSTSSGQVSRISRTAQILPRLTGRENEGSKDEGRRTMDERGQKDHLTNHHSPVFCIFPVDLPVFLCYVSPQTRRHWVSQSIDY